MGVYRGVEWNEKWVNPLIGLRGLRGINSKNGVPPIESVIFYYGIVMGVYRGVEWNEKWVNPLIGLRGLRGINSKNGVSAIERLYFIMESLWECRGKLIEPKSELIP